MEPRISLITIGVSNLQESLRFYRDGLGWPTSSASSDEVAFFHTSGTVFALYPRKELAKDAGIAPGGSGFSGIALAHNVPNREDVDAVLRDAVNAGATLVKQAEDTFWGGRSGYFADPDGFLWEIAWNPGFPLDENDFVQLPG